MGYGAHSRGPAFPLEDPRDRDLERTSFWLGISSRIHFENGLLGLDGWVLYRYIARARARHSRAKQTKRRKPRTSPLEDT